MQSKILVLSTVFVILSSVETRAVTVDFAGAAAGQNQQIAQTYGDSAFANFSYQTLNGGNNWGPGASLSAGSPLYAANANYSGDNAIFALANRKVQIGMTAAPGNTFTGATFKLGTFNNNPRLVDYKIFDGAGSLLQSANGIAVPGVGLMIALNVTAPAYLFQMGDSRFVGVTSVDYTVAPTPAPVPVPPAVLMLTTGLASLGLLRRRRKKWQSVKFEPFLSNEFTKPNAGSRLATI
jgi:hypothetical protein